MLQIRQAEKKSQPFADSIYFTAYSLSPALALYTTKMGDDELSCFEIATRQFVKERCSTVSPNQYIVKQPFPEESAIAVVKVVGFQSYTQRFSAELDQLDGTVFNWQTNTKLIQRENFTLIFVQETLPNCENVGSKHMQYEIHSVCSDVHSTAKITECIKVGTEDLKYHLRYYGVEVAVFKYSNKIFALTYSGNDAKKEVFDRDRSVWDVLLLVINVDPATYFNRKMPHSASYIKFIVGGERFAINTPRIISGPYVIFDSVYTMAYVMSDKFHEYTCGKVNIVDVNPDAIDKPLGEKKGVLFPADLSYQDANYLYSYGYNFEHSENAISNFGENILLSRKDNSSVIAEFMHPSNIIRFVMRGVVTPFDLVDRALYLVDQCGMAIDECYCAYIFPELSYRATIEAIENKKYTPLSMNTGHSYNDKAYYQQQLLRNFLYFCTAKQSCEILAFMLERESVIDKLLYFLGTLKSNNSALELAVSHKMGRPFIEKLKLCINRAEHDLEVVIRFRESQINRSEFRYNAILRYIQVLYFSSSGTPSIDFFFDSYLPLPIPCAQKQSETFAVKSPKVVMTRAKTVKTRSDNLTVTKENPNPNPNLTSTSTSNPNPNPKQNNLLQTIFSSESSQGGDKKKKKEEACTLTLQSIPPADVNYMTMFPQGATVGTEEMSSTVMCICPPANRKHPDVFKANSNSNSKLNSKETVVHGVFSMDAVEASSCNERLRSQQMKQKPLLSQPPRSHSIENCFLSSNE